MRIGLIGCGSAKLKHPAPAKELYTGTHFCKSYTYSEKHYDITYILSGKYGLLECDRIIEPYDMSPVSFLKKDATRWAAFVAQQIYDKIDIKDYLYILAGASYYKPLLPFLRNNYQLPMKHITPLGRRCQWLEQ